MTSYKLPTPPDADVLWVRRADGGEPVRVERHGARVYRLPGGGNSLITWADLLALGEVTDEHPVLAEVSPLPWRADLNGEIVDADGRTVATVYTDNGPGQDRADRSLIVQLVNEYAARHGVTS